MCLNDRGRTLCNGRYVTDWEDGRAEKSLTVDEDDGRFLRGLKLLGGATQ